jgi:signal transduction histidine kinase
MLICVHAKQTPEIDSLLKNFRNSSDDNLKAGSLAALAEYYLEINSDSSLYFSTELQKLSRKLGYPLTEAFALSQMGYIMLNKGYYPKSLEYLLQAIRIEEDPKSENKLLSDEYNYTETWLHEPVTPHMRRMSMLARTHQYLGVLYNNTNNTSKELDQYMISFKLSQETGNVEALCTSYITLGRVYLSLNKPDSALYFEEEAYRLAAKTGYKKYLGSMFLNLGRAHSALGHTEKAHEFYRMAIQASMDQNYIRGVVAANLYIAELFKAAGKTDSTLYYDRVALKIAEPTNTSNLILRCYHALAGVYRYTGNMDSTVKYQELFIKLNDSLFNAKQFQQFENIDADAEQRRLEMAAAKKAYEQRLQNNMLLGGLIAIVIVALILTRNIRNRQKANAKLQQQKAELEKTLEELKNTQAQLIQAEKMASLGELTAGIAHEIQNPLNFVNNFSELNKELIGEMKTELQEGRLDEVKRISESIEDNETKILSHGQRADAIVKSMLQHSRTNTGKKEPVNINVLIDEYVRLTYHGWRAKDKSFNTKLETDYDSSLPLIEVVPQDFARVILNIVNNAFYAVNAKRSMMKSGYEPTVKIATRNSENKIQVTVADNGSGIPPKLVDKIFQPFFTTKPTGQGTGLGLSLSYDIVKSHGGDITVTTKEGQGTEFSITLIKK